MKAQAIVVAYKSADVIHSCVTSLLRDPSITNVIVVNNSRGDLTKGVISDVNDVLYLETGSNIGFGSAVNFARGSVREPFVVLANPDTVQRGHTVTDLLSFVEHHPRAGVVAPRMVDRDNNLYLNSHHAPSFLRSAFQLLGRPRFLMVERSAKDHRRAHLSDYVIGSFVMCRVEALDEIDWFDESIFLFGEDTDLCRRMRQAGREVWFTPVGEVVHLSGHSWRQLDDEGRAFFRAARYRGFRRRGRVQAETYRLFERLLDLLRSLRVRER